MTRPQAALAVVAACVLAGGCGTSKYDKAGGRTAPGSTQTLRLHTAAHGRGGYFRLETRRKPPRFPWAGFAKTDSLADASNERAGFQDTLCLAGGLPGRQNCRVTLSLQRGTIIAEGVFRDGGGLGGTLAVVGGTGAYEGAHGTYQASVPGPNPQAILVHLSLP